LCEAWDRRTLAQRFRDQQAEMAATVERVAWDGEWYARAYDDEGKPLGVHQAAHNQISLNSQTWAVIGGLGDVRRARQAMESAHQKLDTPFGLRLMWPPHDRYDRRVQGTTTFPPGAKENGGIFCHAHTWAVVAAAALGWGDRALEYYRQILPLCRTDADLYRAEPYVYCQNICSPEHPELGRGRNTWLTGTASWAYVAATQWILGIRPTFSGLRIAPVLPEAWPGFEARRLFRGVLYEIAVTRVGPGSRVVLLVDGQTEKGDVVSFPAAGTARVEVRVKLGG